MVSVRFACLALWLVTSKWEAAANRLYYALFHAMSALLIKDGHQVKSHRGVMAMFGEHYVRTEIKLKKDI